MENDKEKGLSPKEQYDLAKLKREKGKQKSRTIEKASAAPKKVGKYILYFGVAVAAVILIGWLFSLVPKLPPTTMDKHVEDSPELHVLNVPMPDRVQRHMLEHADGTGSPGIIIQYNCTDYECEENLVQNLTDLVEEYPENVYLAPNSYDGKIILTKLGRREILDAFDVEKIREFIK